MATTDCATKLAEAKAALHALMTGQQVVQVDNGPNGTRVSYTQANRGALQVYIRDLEAQCGDTATTPRRRPIRFAG